MKKTWIHAAVALGFALAYSPAAFAQDEDPPFECDANHDDCGSPDLSGGGGGGGGGGSILIEMTDLGDSYQHADDFSGDGVGDQYDNCPFHYNPDQLDSSGDGIGDVCDNCPGIFNPTQLDTNGNGIGDACDPDISGDGIPNDIDNCIGVYNPDQIDTNGNSIGDACDPDINGNGIPNELDPCPFVYWNPDTETAPEGPECMRDTSGDGVPDHLDNCPFHYNPGQADLDGDGVGDACDADIDGDLIPNTFDNCELVYNPDQSDADRDGVGDACDDHFCYVVFGDAANCLDPLLPLEAYSPDLLGETGTPIRLRLFANHRSVPLKFTWSLVDAPDGSEARIMNPRGTVSYSSPFEYRYLGENVPHLLADVPGEYQVRLNIENVWEDRITGEMGTSASFTSTIIVEGEPTDLPDLNAGCSSTSGSGNALWLVALVGLIGLVRRKGWNRD